MSFEPLISDGKSFHKMGPAYLKDRVPRETEGSFLILGTKAETCCDYFIGVRKHHEKFSWGYETILLGKVHMKSLITI